MSRKVVGKERVDSLRGPTMTRRLLATGNLVPSGGPLRKDGGFGSLRSTHRTKAEEVVVAERAAKVAQMAEVIVKVTERAAAETEVKRSKS